MNQEVQNSVATLKKGGLLVYPSDTIWGLGCDATNYDAVQKIYALKQREESKSMICLVSNFRMLQQFVEDIPETAYTILKYANKPTTIIYDKPIRVANNLVAADDSLAIRLVHDSYCQRVIDGLKKPLVSTSANISGQPSPKSFAEISPLILDGADYVVNLHRTKKTAQASSIIKLSSDGTVKVIRQ